MRKLFRIKNIKDLKISNIGFSGLKKDLFIKIISEVINAICGILTFGIFATFLTKIDYSVSNQLINLAVLIVPIILLRINTAYVVFLPGETDKEKIKSRFFSTLIISIFQCSIVIIAILSNKALLSYALFGTEDYAYLIPTVAIYYILLALSTLVQEFYRATGRISRSVMLVSLNAVLKAIIFLVFTQIRQGISLHEVVFFYCLIEFIILSIGLFNIFYSYKGIRFRFSFKGLKSYYSYSLPLVPYSIFAWLNTSIGKLMINHLMGLEQSGIYTFNYSLVMRVFILNTVVGYTIFPYISKAWNQGKKEQVSSYISKAYKIGVFLGLPITLGLIAVLPTIAELLSNGNYVADKLLVGLLCVAMIFNMLYSVFSYLIDLSRKTIWYTIILFITSIFNIIINFILIPKYGLYGAASAYLLTNILQAALVIIIGTKITKLVINISIKYTIKCLLISVLMYAFTINIYKDSGLINFFISILTGVIIYFGLHYIISRITNEPMI